MFEKITGINVKEKDITNILNKLGFQGFKKKSKIEIKVPSWRPDIFGEIDLVEG